MTSKRLNAIVERLSTYDEIEVCDLLNITTPDLLKRFKERIVSKQEYLEKELEIIPSVEDYTTEPWYKDVFDSWQESHEGYDETD